MNALSSRLLKARDTRKRLTTTELADLVDVPVVAMLAMLEQSELGGVVERCSDDCWRLTATAEAPLRTGAPRGRAVSLVDAAAVAEILGVPKSWVLESARSGAIPCVRLGRYVRFDLEDVERWLDSCKQPGRPIALRTRP